jgi:hypothetical protein
MADEGIVAMKGRRRWLGLRVWIADPDGKRHTGTLWFTDETHVLIREDGRAGLLELPKAAEGTRWGFEQDAQKK